MTKFHPERNENQIQELCAVLMNVGVAGGTTTGIRWNLMSKLLGLLVFCHEHCYQCAGGAAFVRT